MIYLVNMSDSHREERATVTADNIVDAWAFAKETAEKWCCEGGLSDQCWYCINGPHADDILADVDNVADNLTSNDWGEERTVMVERRHDLGR